MADWRQIQARIRKAKNSPDAPAKLSELYQRTRDAMVAWELAAIEEKAGHIDEAGRWYIISAQRFRRADWKKKAEEALTRLGIELPAPGAVVTPPSAPARGEIREDSEENPAMHVDAGEDSDTSSEANPVVTESENEADSATPAASTADGAKKKRRRGRRGGRGRHRKGAAGAAPGLPSKAFAESSAPSEPRETRIESRSGARAEIHFDPRVERASENQPEEAARERVSPGAKSRSGSPASAGMRSSAEFSTPTSAPMLPSERTAHGRAGDPALASRLARLESMLRRLVSSPLHNLDQAEEAPAGPGVFLLSDSDQITSYYVEACQTLRVGIGNLVRGSGSRGKNPRGPSRGYPDTSGLKAKLAEHLEINETKVSQYLKDHCVIRWIQLDDDAPLLAHFAIAVLRTPLNVD
jgi:hypothetical protein